MTRLRVSRKADQDLVEIFDYIAEDNVAAARRTNAKLIAALETIARQPAIGRSRLDLGEGVRSLPVASYVVYYVRERTRVVIARIVHGARDIPELRPK